MKNFARLFAITLLLCGPRTGFAECGQLSATLTNLPALDGAGYQVNGLNSAGQLTGFFYIAGVHAGHAFVYSAGDLLDANTLGGSSSDGLAINNSGWIVGQSQLDGDAVSHAFGFDGTTLSDLGTLGGSSSSAYAINASGQVAGASSVTNDIGT